MFSLIKNKPFIGLAILSLTNGCLDSEPTNECELSGDCRDRRVFITKADIKGGQIFGLDGADDLCQQYAKEADLPFWFTYQAWLSDSSVNARDRIFLSNSRYVGTTGELIVNGKNEWLSGMLRAPINRDHYGQLTEGSVWTGTNGDGMKIKSEKVNYCEDWTSSELDVFGYIGVNIFTTEDRTLWSDPQANPTPCVLTSKLYCIEGE